MKNAASLNRFTPLNFLPAIAPKTMQECLALVLSVALLFPFIGNVALAQELDSSALQKEAQAEAAAEAKQNAARDANASQPSPAQQSSAAQNQPSSTQSQPPSSAQNPPQAGGMLTVPAGTKVPLGLLRPISVKSSDPVADVYLQITFPVTVGSQMLIPPGAYIQGVIQRTIPRPRGSAGPGFEMRYANLIFPTGYTVPIAGTVNVLRTTAEAPPLDDPESQPVAALTASASTVSNFPQVNMNMNGMPLMAMAAFGGYTLQTLPQQPPLPPLPKSGFGNGPRNALIGIGVLMVLGTVLTFALGHRNGSDLDMETGTPLEMVLPAPLQLDPDRVAAAVQQYSTQTASAPIAIVQPPKPPKMCYDPGSPGTPDTVIPGSPGTPDTVIPGIGGFPDTVIPGSPATPDTVIPGMPGTPSSSYPCPK
ncbi:MAG: hypothetical protein WA738_21855 [Candidatus Angelobacter sp.]